MNQTYLKLPPVAPDDHAVSVTRGSGGPKYFKKTTQNIAEM